MYDTQAGYTSKKTKINNFSVVLFLNSVFVWSIAICCIYTFKRSVSVLRFAQCIRHAYMRSLYNFYLSKLLW